MFTSPEDEASQAVVTRAVEAAFGCRVASFGRLSPIDFWAERDERLVGLLELKTRTHASDRYPTVFLNVRKWLALSLGEHGLGVPALFVVRFTDRSGWIRLADIDPRRLRIGGTRERVKSRNDREPLIEVPVEALTPLPVEEASR